MSPVPPTDIRLDSDGAMVVRQRRRTDAEMRTVLELRLTDSELTEFRAKIVESRFFDEWTRGESATDLPTWNVTAELGERRKSRPQIYGQPQFDPLERLLWRVVDQAQTEEEIRGGGAVSVARRLETATGRARLLRPDAVVADLELALVQCAIDAKRPNDAYEAARCLLVLLPAPEWLARVRELLPVLAGEPRDGALSAWAAGVAEPGHEAQRTGFVPLAVAEVRGSWRDWEKLPYGRQDVLRALLAMAVRERDPAALALAEEMMRSLSTSDRPFVAPGLDLLGADAVSVALRLLGGATAEARAAGAALAERLVRVVKVPPGGNLLPLETRAALERRLTAELLPAVAVRAGDPAEALFVREECIRAVDVWQGRDRQAERREAQAAEAKRRADEQAARQKEAEDAARKFREAQGPPVPHGDGVISGRLVAEGDAGLPGFTVVAQREDGPAANPWRIHGSGPTAADGSFRIDGLADGAFRLIALRGTRWGWREFANNSSARDGVAASTSDVVLRFPGSLVRGRLLDAAGRAVARQQIAVRMRDPPHRLGPERLDVTGWAETDADGRFVVVQLVPGVYDVEVPGHRYLAGADGLVSSAEERTVSILDGGAITGRVLDETGAPLAGAWVAAVPAGAPGERSVSTTGPDGAFRVAELDPAKRWRVAASYQPLTGADRSSQPVEETAGAADIVFRIDTTPRLTLRVDFSRRRGGGGARCIRLVPDGGAGGEQREFDGDRVLWRCAPTGTWRVFALVRDLDGDGGSAERWIEIGAVATGEPERVLVVPR